MKTKSKFYILVILLLGVIGWWYWANPSLIQRDSHGKTEKTSVATPPTPSASAVVLDALYTVPQIRSGRAVNAMLARSPGSAVPLSMLVAAGVSPVEIKKGILDAENAQLIDYYGKIIDQHGDPVVGAAVAGNVLLNSGLENSKYETHATTTDAQGLFQFTGLHGVSIGISPAKAGYEVNNKGYIAPNKEDKSSLRERAILTMWKLKGAELTISDDKFWGINPDGRIFTIDLVGSKKTESDLAVGDLRVSIQRPADAVKTKKFDWSFTLQAVDGGIIETNDAYLNEAPQAGYQQTYTVTMSASDPKWQNEIQSKTFYVKSRDGQVYGHIKIEVIPKYNDTAIFSVQSLVNPAGSRNLEQDDKQTVKAGTAAVKLIKSAK